jgi:hypothetical protein
MDKPLRIMCGRSGMLGDTLAALTIPNYFRKIYPDAHLIWPIGKRFSQAAPIYINQGVINEIFIFDGEEKPESKRDWDIVKSCGIIINPTPEHFDDIYPSQRTIYKESFLMGGLSEIQWESLSREEQRPKLNKWWKDEPKLKKTIAYWPQAGYGVENKRNASLQWRQELVFELKSLGYKIFQFGSEKDDDLMDGYIQRFSYLSFFEQVKLSLKCELVIGTDSGSQLILGAYGIPQISLLTNHWREDQDPHSLEVDNLNNFSFWAKGRADNISVDSVVTKIKDILK